jgi:CheY-like chemotaxis protein
MMNVPFAPPETMKRVLVADDDPVARTLVVSTLERWGYETLAATDGKEALETLVGPNAPRIAILDWVMPHLEGIEVCEEVRRHHPASPPYMILLTSKSDAADISAGLEAGAHDFMSKPFDPAELQARLRAGLRTVKLQDSLHRRVRELEAANQEIQHLRGLLPICSYCKNIRNDQNYWEKVESYFLKNVGVRFTHGVCPACQEEVEKRLFGESPDRVAG